MADFGAARGGWDGFCPTRDFVCCIVYCVCLDGGANREIGANIEN